MEDNYQSNEEIKNIVKSLSSQPELRGYEYDQHSIFFRGPKSFKYSQSALKSSPTEQINLSENEAMIGLVEPISPSPLHLLLIVEKNELGNWQTKRKVMISKG